MKNWVIKVVLAIFPTSAFAGRTSWATEPIIDWIITPISFQISRGLQHLTENPGDPRATFAFLVFTMITSFFLIRSLRSWWQAQRKIFSLSFFGTVFWGTGLFVFLPKFAKSLVILLGQ